jgi:hypothetical protein
MYRFRWGGGDLQLDCCLNFPFSSCNPAELSFIDCFHSPVFQLQSALNWGSSDEVPHVKTMSAPRRMSEQQLRKLLELQKEMLQEMPQSTRAGPDSGAAIGVGRERMLLVPLLLRLADAVRDTVPLE